MMNFFLGLRAVHRKPLPGGGTEYTHDPGDGTEAITVSVTYHKQGVTDSIHYEGLGAAAAKYRGYLDYTLEGSALLIHTMKAEPEGDRLGSLLLYECTNKAAFHGKDRITALNVAPTARAFYLKCGFHPNSQGRHSAEGCVQTPAFGQDFATRLHLARNIGNWDGYRQHIQASAFGQINGYWI